MKMIMVCETKPNIEGKMDHRPLEFFPSMDSARKFLRVLAANGVYATVKEV